MTHPVLVLANEATRRGSRRSFSKVLNLEYRPNRKNAQNINLTLPDFVRGVLHLPNRILDLLEIAAFVYSADRMVSRGAIDDLEYQRWSRSFDFVVKVRDADFWNSPSVRNELSEALAFMSGDRQFAFRFQPGHTTEKTGLFDRSQFTLQPKSSVSVLLFSGGIDSLAGAVERLEEGDHVCLVSHRSQTGTMHTQDSLVEALKANLKYRDRVQHYPFGCTLRGVNPPEETQRTRAFLYASIAFALHHAFSDSRLFICENGVTSLNFQRREDLGNARASRTTHPRTLFLLSKLFSSVAGASVRLEAPFRRETKASMFEKLRKHGVEHLISSSVSCSRTRTNLGGATQCGTCYQCVDRRIAAFSTRTESADHEGLYARDMIRGPLEPSDRTVIVDYIRQARDFATWNVDHFCDQTLTQLADAILLDTGEDEHAETTAIWRLCQRYGGEVVRGLKRIQELHEDLFEEKRTDSLLGILADREYLKEPTSRVIERIVSTLEIAIPKMFGKGKRPVDEPDLNQKINAIVDAARDEIVSEHPAATFGGARVIPDHELSKTDVLIESKYVRGATTLSKVTDAIAADITKYPARKHTLFVIYDPDTTILDPAALTRDTELKGRCTLRVFR